MQRTTLIFLLATLAACGAKDDTGSFADSNTSDADYGGATATGGAATGTGTGGWGTTAGAGTGASGTGTGATGSGTGGFGTGTGMTSGTGTGAAGTGTGATGTGTGATGTGTGATGTGTGATGTGTGSAQVCDTIPDQVLYLSPDDSNSMASAALARTAASHGRGFAPTRPYELMNYYTFDYPPADAGKVAIHAELAPDPTDPLQYVMQLGLSSEAMDDADRPPINLTMVVDTSCSMSGTPIAMMRASCSAIAGALDVGDTVSMVTWSDSQQLLLDGLPIDGPDDHLLVQTCQGLAAGGGTDLHAGLVRGYQLAERNHIEGQTNRVVLISDGGANLGVTDADLIAEKAARADGREIYLVGIGVGTQQTYSDRLMDAVTDAGKGSSVFIDSAEEANKMLGERFVNTFEVAARDVEIALAMPESLTIVRSSAEGISTQRLDPQHIAPNDAMVINQTLATTTPECVDHDTELTIEATWLHPRTLQRHTASRTFTMGELLQTDPSLLHKGTAVAHTAEVMRKWATDSPRPTAARDAARASVEEALEWRPGDPDLLELRDMLDGLR